MNILIGIACGCLLVLGLVFFFQHKLIFFPDPQLAGTPAQIDLEYEEVAFRAQDGVELHGWYLPAFRKADGPTALFFHGNAGNISYRLEQLRIIHSLALIIESSFPSIPVMAKRLFPFFPVSLLLRYRFPTEDNLQEVACPVLIVHSREDGLVPFDFGRRLYENAPEPKDFLELQGGRPQ